MPRSCTELENDLDAWVAYAGSLERELAMQDEEIRTLRVQLWEARTLLASYSALHVESLAAPTPPATDDAGT